MPEDMTQLAIIVRVDGSNQKPMIHTLGTDIGQQLGEGCVRLGHVVTDEDGDDAVELLAVFFPQHRYRLQNEPHLLQFMGT